MPSSTGRLRGHATRTVSAITDQGVALNPFTRFSRHRDNHERGATLILVAISMTALIAASGMAVDLGRTFVTNRSLQLVADAAALDSARYIAAQETLTLPSSSSNLVVEANNAVSDNRSGANLSVIEGLWTSQTFTPESGAHCKGSTPPTGNLPCNAVKVTATSNLARLFSHGTSTLSRTAVAADTPEAAFSIGSYLASATSPSPQTSVLGVLLGKLGASANLTAVGYAGLANTFVSVQQLINASGGILTPTNVMSATLSGAQWDSFLNGAVSSQAALLTCGNTPTPYPCAATSVLRPFVLSPGPLSSTSLQLCQIVSIDGSSCGSQLSQVALSTDVNVLQTLTTEAELANGASGLDVTAALGLTDTLGHPVPAVLYLSASAIHPPAVAYGPVGTTASTGQVGATLALTVPVPLVGNQVLNIPIAAATGTATLKTVTCQSNALYKAIISAGTTASGPNSVTLNNSPIATLTLNGVSPPNLLSYGAPYVPPSPTTATAGFNPINVATSTPTVSFGLLPGSLPVLVSTLLNTTVPPILGPVLQALGVEVAGAQVADLSTNCAAVSLVK
jgi:uncharacterized membrane protein